MNNLADRLANGKRKNVMICRDLNSDDKIKEYCNFFGISPEDCIKYNFEFCLSTKKKNNNIRVLTSEEMNEKISRNAKERNRMHEEFKYRKFK